MAGQGVCPVATGNVPLPILGGATTRPVHEVTPSRYALAWRTEDAGRPLVRAYAEACRQAATRGDPDEHS